MNVTIGATLTGGTVKALSPAGVAPGKSTFVSPDHSRLTPETVEFTTAPGTPQNTDPGVARSGLKLSFASREMEEGCCTVKAGAVIVDVNFRWNLNQPEAVADDVYDWLQGILYTAECRNSFKKGILPST
jgi:hypothetical protein